MIPAAFALAAQLNNARHNPISPEVAACSVIGAATAHHVIDPEGLLGLNPLAANELDTAMAAALVLVDSDWALVLPRPGRLAPLTGPPPLTGLALAAGAAVIPLSGGPAWVPTQVGPAIQWQLTPSNRPGSLPDPREADRRLREVVLTAARELPEAIGSMAEQPGLDEPLQLPGAFGARAQHLTDRAWQMLIATEYALTADHDVLHLHDLETRRSLLSELRDAAIEALCAAVTWPVQG